MARTKTVVVNDVEYQLQSVNFTWYSNLTDLYINPANGRKNTAKYHHIHRGVHQRESAGHS